MIFKYDFIFRVPGFVGLRATFKLANHAKYNLKC